MSTATDYQPLSQPYSRRELGALPYNIKSAPLSEAERDQMLWRFDNMLAVIRYQQEYARWSRAVTCAISSVNTFLLVLIAARVFGVF